jgi:hypothetical protein
MGTPGVRITITAGMGALLSLIPWGVGAVFGLVFPVRPGSGCRTALYICLADWGTGLLDLVMLAVVPVILMVLLVIIFGWVLLHTLKVRPAARITLIGLALVVVATMLGSPASPSVITAVIWAVCYAVAEVVVSATRAGRVSTG